MTSSVPSQIGVFAGLDDDHDIKDKKALPKLTLIVAIMLTWTIIIFIKKYLNILGHAFNQYI